MGQRGKKHKKETTTSSEGKKHKLSFPHWLPLRKPP